MTDFRIRPKVRRKFATDIIQIRLSGNSTFLSPSQQEKAPFPILAILSDISMLSSPLQSLNISFGTSVIELESLDEYIMPDSDVSINVEFENKTYTVKFICNGETVSEKQYSLGDKIEIPEIELSFEENGFLYTFLGWSENVSVVDGDVTVYAKYLSVPIEEYNESLDTQSAIDVVITEQLIPVLAVVAVIGAVVSAGIVMVVKRKKVKKAPKDDFGEEQNSEIEEDK